MQHWPWLAVRYLRRKTTIHSGSGIFQNLSQPSLHPTRISTRHGYVPKITAIGMSITGRWKRPWCRCDRQAAIPSVPCANPEWRVRPSHRRRSMGQLRGVTLSSAEYRNAIEPISTFGYRSFMCAMTIRTQPELARPPMLRGCGVPWMRR